MGVCPYLVTAVEILASLLQEAFVRRFHCIDKYLLHVLLHNSGFFSSEAKHHTIILTKMHLPIQDHYYSDVETSLLSFSDVFVAHTDS